ncbi:MAG: hypothetical protein KDE58_38895, partial [Caldilineaceae bacterium]|nr:hypothetical protein [Caldilineaceae bacterium]
MTTTPNLTQLRSILVYLYPAIGDAWRVADDAGVVHSRSNSDDTAINVWHGLLQEAERQEKLTALLAVAAAEYPRNQELVAAVTAHQHALLPLSDVHLLNFAHPLSAEQQRQIETRLGRRLAPTHIRQFDPEFDDSKPYEPQCAALATAVGFTAEEWKALPILVNPPSFVPGALCLLAELHGRMR